MRSHKYEVRWTGEENGVKKLSGVLSIITVSNFQRSDLDVKVYSAIW